MPFILFVFKFTMLPNYKSIKDVYSSGNKALLGRCLYITLLHRACPSETALKCTHFNICYATRRISYYSAPMDFALWIFDS